MKKILSFALLLALLMGCLAPCAFAVEGPSIVAESVEKLQGANKNVGAELAFENNPGTYSMQLIVYYDSSELALGDTEGTFARSIFGADDSTIGAELAGTNTKIRSYIPSELRSTSRGFIIDLYGVYDEEIEDTAVVYGDGVVAEIPFTILANDMGEYSYTVIVAEAYDENGDELEVAGSEGTVNYVKDQYIDIYDEFTVFMTPEKKDIESNAGTVDVDIRFDQNPGLWATRVYIVYPDELTLDNGSGIANVDNNTGIFLKNSDMILGYPDLDLTDERQVQMFKVLMEQNPSIVKDGYHSTTLYFERQDSYEEVYEGNGVLCTLHFKVDPNADVDKPLDIKLYYGEADFLYASTDPETNEPVFINYWPEVYGSTFTVRDCFHTDVTTGHLDPTCTTDGYDGTFCNECKRVVSGEKLPALNHPERIKEGEIAATCTQEGYTGDSICTICGELVDRGEVIPVGDHTPGEEINIAPTCTANGKYKLSCAVCGATLAEETYPKLGHSVKIEGAVDATCTKDGYTGDEVCQTCGETLVAGKVISAVGHGETVVVGAVEPTVAKDGYTGDTICTVCKEVIEAGQVIPAIEIIGSALVAEPVEKMQGADKHVSADIELYNNPGTYSMQLIVYYDSSELKLGDTEDTFASSIFGADDSTIGAELAGTNAKIRNYIPSELRSTSRGFIIDLYGVYDEETEDTAVIYGDGIVASLPFEILGEEFKDYNYTVVVVEAYDENGEEYELSGTVGTITYSPDPYTGKYDEFTVFFTPENIDYDPDEGTVDIDLRLDNNPGLWAARVYIVYPEGLSLDNGFGVANVDNNTGIFLNNSDMILGFPDIELTDPTQVQSFQDLMRQDPSIVKDGYHSTTLYFERQDSYEEVYTDSGVLCTLHFTVDPSVDPGTDLDINLYYGESDFLFAGTDDKTGEPIFVSYYPDVFGSTITVAGCDHTNIKIEHKDVTCTVDGYDRTVCADCGAVIEETIIKAEGHTTLQQHSTVIVEATCTTDGSKTRYCDVCREVVSVEILPAWGHDYDGGTEVTVEPTCTTAGIQVTYCDFCGEVSKTEEIPALNHPEESYVLTGAKEPTATMEGYSGDIVCGLCQMVIVSGETIPALGTGDPFRVSAAPAITNIVYGGDFVDVDIIFENNPGIWSSRLFVVYPDALTLDDGTGEPRIENSFEIFPGISDMSLGYADLSIDDERQVDAFKDLITEQDITVEGYQSTMVYFELKGYDDTTYEDGVLCTLRFNVDSEAIPYDILDISLYYAEGDFLWAGTDETTGQPIFETFAPEVAGTDLCVAQGACKHNNVVDEYKDAGCVEDGYERTVCTDCGEIISYVVIPALNHPEKTLHDATEATCTAEGYTGDIICDICGDILEKGATVPALNHPMVHIVGAVDPTETTDGYTGDTVCTICGVTIAKGEKIPAFGTSDDFTVYAKSETNNISLGTQSIDVDIMFANNPGLWATRIYIVYPEGLSLANGTYANIDNSGKIFTGADDMIAGYADLALDDPRQVTGFKNLLKADPSIMRDGYRSATVYFEPEDVSTVITADGVLCTLHFNVDPDVNAGDVLDIKIHYSEYDFLQAKLDKNGFPVFTSLEPKTFGTVISVDMCSHSDTVRKYVEPTCTEDGFDGTVCNICGEIISGEVLPALGHTEGDPVKVDATCTSVGYITYKCSDCGYTLRVEEIPVADHSYKDTVVPPTTTEEGYTLHTCTVCGTSYKDNFKDPIGGSDTEWVYGDFDGDGLVNAKDLNISKRLVAGSVTPSLNQTIYGDVNGDGTLNGLDANLLARYVSGSIPSFNRPKS